ncbi:MAG TPA: patatin-like phospholipase family protein, partial [Thermoanaerobaculia bacterium]|nr:patatin-like phospholipase family protein [Thermoanaerobaculia bacterium]
GRRVGLAMAGGGPEGAVYEIGALRALEDAFVGVDFNDLEVYVGVSSGGFLGACLANGVEILDMAQRITSEPGDHRNPFRPEIFFSPSRKELMGRIGSVPRLLGEAIRRYLSDRDDLTLLESLMDLSQALPVGIFDNEPVRLFLETLIDDQGGTNDFRQLKRKLRIVTADLDSGQAVVFGAAGHDHVPISDAVQASTALPGLYPPVEIDGRYYVDGVLLKTVHASVALEEGAQLLFCINPIVPVDTARAVEAGVMKRGKLIDRGLPTVLSQTLRTLIRSRLGVGMKAYEKEFPGSDVVLLEPKRDDYRMFFTNVFSFSDRRATCEHAYRETLGELRRRREELEPVLARHGITLRDSVLADEGRDLWVSLGPALEREHRERLARKNGRNPEVERLDRALARLEGIL